MSINIVEDGELKNISGGNIDSISVNGSNVLPDSNKNVNIVVPTKTSQLTNDSNFQTKDNLDLVIGNLKYNPESYATNVTDLVNKAFSARGLGTNSGTPKVGDATWKGVATTVNSGNTNLVTSGAVYSALQSAGGASVEEGTWTPQLYSGSTLISHKFSITAKYFKIGKLVCVICSSYNNTNTTSTAFGRIKGLPFMPISINPSASPTGNATFFNNTAVSTSSGVYADAIGTGFSESNGVSVAAGNNFYCFAMYITN